MPELPEVEVVAGGLTCLLGQRFLGAAVSGQALRGNLCYGCVDGGLARLNGEVLTAVGRRGRYLILQFSADKACLVHLGMTGSFMVLPSLNSSVGAEDRFRHLHVQLFFSDYRLLYCDARRFGGWELASGPVLQHVWLAKLGVEPLSPEQLIKVSPMVTHYVTEPLNAEYLFTIGKRKPYLSLKRLLMDNYILTGVGNIYATEILFAAGLHPMQTIGKLTLDDWQRLVDLIQDFLLRSIASGGCSVRDYRHSDGDIGHFQDELLIYGRFGQSCPKCHAMLDKVMIDGRSSVYCPRCQPVR